MSYRLVFVWILVLFLNVPVFSQTLHFLVMADTHDETIGKSVKKDFKNLKDLAQKIASNTGMTLNLTAYEGNDFSLKNANRAINSISPDQNDAVIVYISAHGFRERDSATKWPNIYFPEGEYLEENDIYKRLAKKKPRLLIVLADVCNSYTDDDGSVPNVIPRSLNDKEAENYTTLFVNSKGAIVASSSKPGQASIAESKGGSYTLAVLNALKNAVKSSSPPRWADIMKTSGKPIGSGSSRQDPQYELFSFTEGGKTNNSVVTTNTPVSKKMKFTFSSGKLEEQNSKKWNLTLDGTVYNLKEYERDKTYIYFTDEENETTYALDLPAKVFFQYDWDREDWDTIADDLK
ncbi:caspase family protein [Leptospira idonii]|uniref:Peptidase C14 caspase domain-containing protein n=1 Tax=Leptospira idonii TaxID=1193500 RepID=A0A4R9M8Z9_9LEPT|nr:caspase family protein [Leptospira idonii]TGN20968.1 hypothetical protein EHS15_00140 [Leptospira idonii]